MHMVKFHKARHKGRPQKGTVTSYLFIFALWLICKLLEVRACLIYFSHLRNHSSALFVAQCWTTAVYIFGPVLQLFMQMVKSAAIYSVMAKRISVTFLIH